MKKWLSLMVLMGLTSVSYANNYVLHQKNQSLEFYEIQVLNFWATWCEPCRKEMPIMSKWYEQKGKKEKIAMIGVAIDRPENITTFLQTTPVSYPIVRYVGKDYRKVLLSYGNEKGGFPFTVVMAPNCRETSTTLGELTIQRLEESIQIVKNACSKA